VKHKFRKVIDLEKTDAQSICAAIINYFNSKGIDWKKLVMFTSDGAAVMLGAVNGTCARLKHALDSDHIISFNCVAHLQALIPVV